ncbi:MAG: hypothetical protein COB98_10230 [Flavobacteriaceae bacterium]|nr:MAG: hypothetical protein COB98_10230 [Flavobacteriaceae bacterium]
MINKVINTVKEKAGAAIQESTGMTADQAGEAVKISVNTAWDKLKDTAMSGDISSLMDIFKDEGNVMDKKVVKDITSSIKTELDEKMNVSSEMADKFISVTVPETIESLKTTLLGDDGKFDMSDITRILKEQGGGLLGSITSMFK